MQLQQDLLPNISVPEFVVVTAYPGASPGMVDQLVPLLRPDQPALSRLREIKTLPGRLDHRLHPDDRATGRILDQSLACMEARA